MSSLFPLPLLQVYVAFANVAHTEEGLTFSALIRSCSITEIFIAIAGTYGTWIISALLAFQPWHLVTSLLQYILLAPTYINLLNVYAFANISGELKIRSTLSFLLPRPLTPLTLSSSLLFQSYAFANIISDVSWGTKGSVDSPDERALDSDHHTHLIGEKTANSRAQVSLPRAEQLEASYEAASDRLRQQTFLSTRREQKIEKTGLTGPEREAYETARTLDYYSSFRTALIMIWGSTNVFLVVVVLSIQSGENLLTGAVTELGADVCSSRGITYMR